MAFAQFIPSETLQQQITRYQRALHDLGISIGLAEQANQPEVVERLRVQFNAVVREVNRLAGKKLAQEMPSKLALGVANIGEAAARKLSTLGNVAMVALVGVGALLLLPLLRRRS